MTLNYNNLILNANGPLRTAEFVSPKHPDKICDQISDAILDAYLKKDKNARVAIDVAGGHGKVFVTGEVSSKVKNINLKNIVKRLAGDVQLIENISKQSPEIARGVDAGGAGDQGIMVGYATNETAELLPLEYVLARDLNQYLYKKFPYDGKTQITIRDKKIVAIVASFQNSKNDDLREAIYDWLYKNQFYGNRKKTIATCRLPITSYSSYMVRGIANQKMRRFEEIQKSITFHINPCGEWSIGGFDADAGLTGRKLVVDNYGPRVPIGGGAFSGKDPSKIDRSGAYMARHLAVEFLKKAGAKEVYVYLAYAIGHDTPIEVTVVVDGVQSQIENSDLTPNKIIQSLKLRQPIYEATARTGHFGAGYFWDK